MAKLNHQQHTSSINQSQSASMRWIYLVLGWLFFILGLIGVLLPVMPTAPFVLLAAACWARGSKRFYLWLINHRRFGHYVRNWEERRAIPRKAKWFATAMMVISGAVSFMTVPVSLKWVPWLMLLLFIIGLSVVWRFPDA